MKNGINHSVLHSLLIVIIAPEPYFSDSQALAPMLILSAVRHFIKTTLFSACTPPAGSATEHLFTYTVKDEDGNCQGQVV